jgi:hypothetical protein
VPLFVSLDTHGVQDCGEVVNSATYSIRMHFESWLIQRMGVNEVGELLIQLSYRVCSHICIQDTNCTRSVV